MIKLVTLRKEDIPFLRSIVDARIKEANGEDRMSTDRCLTFVMDGYDRRIMGAYADNPLDPKVCLVLLHAPDMFSETVVVHVCLVYVSPELRGNLSIFSDLETYIENYARLVGATQVVASSWVFKGARSMSAMWKKHGFEEQEIKFIKFLDK